MAYYLESLKVLCVEENKYMQQIMGMLLSSLGFRNIRFALDGGEALELMQTTSFDLIFSDLNTTPINGFEFLRFARRSTGSTRSDVPIIICSGSTEVRNIEEARDAGATEFMAKPMSAQSLYKRIQVVIERPRDFLEHSRFKGPDRRRRNFAVFDGADRRVAG